MINNTDISVLWGTEKELQDPVINELKRLRDFFSVYFTCEVCEFFSNHGDLEGFDPFSNFPDEEMASMFEEYKSLAHKVSEQYGFDFQKLAPGYIKEMVQIDDRSSNLVH